MSGSAGHGRERARGMIKRLVAVARRVADPKDALGVEARARLLATTGLSREGIELALTEHLETNPSDEEIDALIASQVGSAPRCHVVIAANVCTAALRAIAVAAAAAPHVLVRPSSRDPVLAELLVRELRDDPVARAAGGSIALASDLRPSPGDELHIYGSDQTIDALRAAAGPGVIVRGHGTGIGVAAVDLGVDEHDAVRALARDVIPFDQRGCLSPRVALVEGSLARAADVCDKLHEELGASRIPRGELDNPTLAEFVMYRASVQALGALWEGPHHAIGLDFEPRSLLLPPAARVVHVVPTSPDRVRALLDPLSRYVTAVGAIDHEGALARAIMERVPSARRSRLGFMQRPPFDGPVDRRLK